MQREMKVSWSVSQTTSTPARAASKQWAPMLAGPSMLEWQCSCAAT